MQESQVTVLESAIMDMVADSVDNGMAYGLRASMLRLTT